MKKLIIFDYDGVIVNTFSLVHGVYQEVCRELEKECPSTLPEFEKVYGRNSTDCHTNLGFTDKEVLIGNKMHKEIILEEDILPFEGIIEVIRKLSKQYTIVVISSALEVVVKKNLEKFGLSECILEIIGKKNVGIKRFEKSEAIKSTVEKYSTPEDTVSIGDRNVDFIEGTAAGLKNIILVDYGWKYYKEDIPEYDQRFIIKRPSDLIEAVEKTFKIK